MHVVQTGGSVEILRTGGRWFDPRLGQYSFRGFMIVIVTGFIPLSPLSVVSTKVMGESSQWFGNNIVRSTGKKNFRKAWIGVHWPPRYYRNTVENGVKHHTKKKKTNSSI